MNVIRSQQFDDIYFSPENGLEETRHTFLQGNNLPDNFAGKRNFTIVESGFGTGLNFLAVARLFTDHAEKDVTLDYISFEKYPLGADQIADVLGLWRDELGADYFDALIENYPLRVNGFHRLCLSPRIRLTLVFDDMNRAMPELHVPRGVDAWFLDGFAPAKNPDMWSDTLFHNMTRLSRSGATVATFTAAGDVRRGLAAAGFMVEKKPGYGRKREMVVGVFHGGDHNSALASGANGEDGRRIAEPDIVPDVMRQGDTRHIPRKIAVIGSGLAGASCAYVLGQYKDLYDLDITVFERSDNVASGASGNYLGLYNPRISMLRGEDSELFSAGFSGIQNTLKHFGDSVEYNPCGALHLAGDAEKTKRFSGMVKNWGWHDDHIRFVDKDDASQIAGLEIQSHALYLPDSGSVSPRKLCAAYIGDITVRYGVTVSDLVQQDTGWLVNGEYFDAVILACAVYASSYDMLSWLPVYTVRGQVSCLEPNEVSATLKTNLCYSGYVSPVSGGRHIAGATFSRKLDHTEPMTEDDIENAKRLAEVVPALAGLEGGIMEGSSWAGLRTSSRDHSPIAGRVPDYRSWAKEGAQKDLPNMYISTAHGSHGIVSSLASAKLITDMILELPYSLPVYSVQALAADRFLRRARRKGQL